MTLQTALDPNQWGAGWRWVIGALLSGMIAIAGTAIMQAYNFGVEREHQRSEFTAIHSDIKDVRSVVELIKTEQERQKDVITSQAATIASAANATAAVAHNLATDEAQHVPRIDRLETAINNLTPDVAAIKQAVNDIRETTKGHDDDLRAIRAVVSPKEIPYNRGH